MYCYVVLEADSRVVQTWYQLNVPATAPSFVSVTEEQFNKIVSYKGAILNTDGTVAEFTPETPTFPLKEQAAAALSQARITVYNNYGILNEPTPDAWVSYLKDLMAIENGSDTTSTKLPTQPSV